MKVAAPFQFTDFVQVPPTYNLVIETSNTSQPIALNTLPEPAAGLECEVTGWGVTAEDGLLLAPVLQAAAVPLVADAECFLRYGGLMRSSMICAGAEVELSTNLREVFTVSVPSPLLKDPAHSEASSFVNLVLH